MRFTKMNGLGNDYIFIDTKEEKIKLSKKEIIRLCDRNFGIGGDGVVLLEKSAICTLKMIIFNSDGSRAEICGNALRCAAKYAFDKGISKERELSVETDAGQRMLTVLNNGFIRVDMGVGIVDLNPKTFFNEEINGYYVNVGNPHFVVFCQTIDRRNKLFDAYAKSISEERTVFPNGTNVEFVVIDEKENELNVRVFERGSNETLACGTGATAVFSVACKLKMIKNQAKVILKGGTLTFFQDEKKHIIMIGKADYNFSGETIE